MSHDLMSTRWVRIVAATLLLGGFSGVFFTACGGSQSSVQVLSCNKYCGLAAGGGGGPKPGTFVNVRAVVLTNGVVVPTSDGVAPVKLECLTSVACTGVLVVELIGENTGCVDSEWLAGLFISGRATRTLGVRLDACTLRVMRRGHQLLVNAFTIEPGPVALEALQVGNDFLLSSSA